MILNIRITNLMSAIPWLGQDIVQLTGVRQLILPLIRPIMVYSNAEEENKGIIKENRGKAGVYRITHKESGKTYVGSSTDLGKIFSCYLRHSYFKDQIKLVIFRALLKYGLSKVIFEVIEYCEPAEIIKREQHYLDMLKPEYNTLKIAGSSLVFKHTEETKGKMVSSALGRKHTEKTRAKMVSAAVGRHAGRNLTVEHKAKIAASLKGRTMSIETKKKISEAVLIKGNSHPASSEVKVTDMLRKEKNTTTEYTSFRKAAIALHTSHHTIKRHMMSKTPYLSKYLISSVDSTRLSFSTHSRVAKPAVKAIIGLPTIGTVPNQALVRKGGKARTEKKEFLAIPYSFLSMLVGFIDGDGHISIIKSTKGFITLNLTISLHVRDLSTLQYMQSVLGIGRINIYSKINTCKLVINKTDLREVLFPLLLHHKLFFLTEIRREQLDKALFILQNDIKLFSAIPAVIPSIFPLATSASGYAGLPFFKNWIVGFTMAEGSFLFKSNLDACFQLRKRKHVLLFEAFKIVFGSGRKIGLSAGHNLFSVCSISDIQRVVNFFSFSGHHPLVGYKWIQYEQWLTNLRNSKRYSCIKFP